MQQAAVAAFVLRNQGVGDVEHYLVANRFQSVDLRHGARHAVGSDLEADEIVHAAFRQAIEMAGDADHVMVEQRGNADDLRNLATEQPGDVGPAANAGALQAKFVIAIDQVTDHFVLVVALVVPAGLDAAGDADAVLVGQVEVAGEAELGDLAVPDDDVLGGMPAASKPSTTAAATAGRVPLFGPGVEKTLIPTMSCVLTRLRQAATTEALPVRLVMPRSTIARMTAGRATKASRASPSWTMTTRARGPGLAKEGGVPVWARAEPASRQAHNTGISRRERTRPSGAFLDTSEAGCYHERRC